MPTNFRWLWYLVGLAGMILSVIGIVAILGSAADLGIVVPVVVIGAIVIAFVIVRFRRSLQEAVANAPSRHSGTSPTSPTDPEVTTPTRTAGGPAGDPATNKPPSGPPRTSRR